MESKKFVAKNPPEQEETQEQRLLKEQNSMQKFKIKQMEQEMEFMKELLQDANKDQQNKQNQILQQKPVNKLKIDEQDDETHSKSANLYLKQIQCLQKDKTRLYEEIQRERE